MPSYEFICLEEDCKHEWEDFLSITAPNPSVCPKCNKESVKKLISLGGKGIVELTGQDLVDKTKADIKQLKKDMHSSERVYSNLVGEAKYEKVQKRIDRQKRGW